MLGQAPEVRPGQEVFVSPDSPTQTVQVKANGEVSASGGSPSFYLPFRVAGKKKYVLGLDVEMKPSAPTEDWYALAFTRGPLPEGDKSLAVAYSALFLIRANGDAQFLTWGTDPAGPGTAQLGATAGRLEIILDNTQKNSPLATLEFRLNGKTVYQTAYAGMEYNPDTIDPITHIGFGKFTSDFPSLPGKVGNLKLEIIP
ncbi:MAG: hypothetical protein EBS97_02835 [Verrucomicrobia bacterium]|nr:hypothetical protein [Verrucomicrobiota bacterium]